VSLIAPRFGRREWLWLLLAWGLAIATLLLRLLNADVDRPFFVDTDDAMRMVVVRDFLNGQGWFDLVQHRLNTPYGAEVHWSRLVDLPIAALLWFFGGLASPQWAMLLTGAVWPALLLGVLLWLSARTAIELVGPEGLLPALVLPIVSPAVLAEFNPGRVDHHGVIMVLTLALLLASLVALRRPIAAWIAGLLAATALAIAIEALPIVVAAILAFGVAYIVEPGRARALRGFGLGFGLGLAGHLALARPPALWLDAACDMISPVFVLAGLLVGGAFTLVSLVPAPPKAWQRLLLLGTLGAVAGVLVLALFPQCLAGPYGELDPWLRENWLGNIIEARPWHVSLLELPSYALMVAVPVLLGLGAAIAAFRAEPPQRLGWLVLIIFIVTTALVMLVQIRGARLAILPVAPAAAWLIAKAREAYVARPRPGPAAALIASWLAFSGVALSVVVNGAMDILPAGRAQMVREVRDNKLPCLVSEAFADLRGLPPERIMTPIDLGAHMLLETSHHVVSAPYHRNQDGVLDTFRFFNRPAEEAHAIARERGLGLLVTCEALPEMERAGLDHPGSILQLLAAGTPPDWLEEVPTPGPLKVYTIER
jgi:hypothetical protein